MRRLLWVGRKRQTKERKKKDVKQRRQFPSDLFGSALDKRATEKRSRRRKRPRTAGRAWPLRARALDKCLLARRALLLPFRCTPNHSHSILFSFLLFSRTRKQAAL